MTSQQRLVPIFVLIVILGAIGYSLIPFQFADRIDCGAPLLGAHAQLASPANEREARAQQVELSQGLIRPEEDCRSKGKSRLAVAGVASVVAALVGTAMVGLKPESHECLAGNHDDCHEWWAGLMGGAGTAMSCQCSCHAQDSL